LIFINVALREFRLNKYMRISDQQIVRALPLFKDIREEHFSTLMGAALLQTFPPRVQLIREGELPDFLHVIVEGAVELYAGHRDRETTIDVIVPTTTFILAAVIRDEVYLKSARTLTQSRVLMIPADAVRDIFGRDGAFARAVVGELALRYRGIMRALKNQKLRTGMERLANWILQTDLWNGSVGELTLPFEKRLLAALLGMTPENLSRSFTALTSYGVVSHGRAIMIKDREKLQHLAQENPLIEELPEVAQRSEARQAERPFGTERIVSVKPN
jgi:CRP/FNR family transcriptional activator FtrB